VKYKAIKSAAHNFGDSFASGLNYAANDYIMSHLARRALASGRGELTVDILSGEAGPAELVEPPVEQSIAGRVRGFSGLLSSQLIDPGVVRAARMRIVFDIARCTAPAAYDGYTVQEMPFDCWVEIVDDHQRAHRAHFHRWWSFSAERAEFGAGFRANAWRRLAAWVADALRSVARSSVKIDRS
jgi:hypothetical protein